MLTIRLGRFELRAKLLVLTLSATLGSNLAFAEIGGNPEHIPGWVFACETDSAGNVIAGNCNRLDKAVSSGGDLKVRIGGTSSSDYFYCENVHAYLDGSSVLQHGCTYTQLNLFGTRGALPLAINGPPRINYTYVDTEGRFAVVRTSANGGASQGNTITAVGARWYAKVR